jgi:hypothetical protein
MYLHITGGCTHAYAHTCHTNGGTGTYAFAHSHGRDALARSRSRTRSHGPVCHTVCTGIRRLGLLYKLPLGLSLGKFISFVFNDLLHCTTELARFFPLSIGGGQFFADPDFTDEPSSITLGVCI